jgi:hypothetical protein
VFAKPSGFGMGVRCVVSFFGLGALNDKSFFRVVAFMDLGLLIIANLIMRTRLPSKQRGNEGGSVLKEVMADGPYLLFVTGSFLVRGTYPTRSGQVPNRRC